MSLWASEIGGYPAFDDLRFPFSGQRLDTSSGRIDFNFVECSVDFQSNARYPNEPICMIAQMPHAKQFGEAIRPHIHWIQEQDEVPNFLIGYRFYNNGGQVPAWTYAACESTPAFDYTGPSMLQINDFPHIATPTDEDVSAICDVRIFRDTDNDSGLFAGADPYVGTVKTKEFDFHVKFDAPGSRQEYIK